MMKPIFGLFLILALSGCTTLEQRLAKRVGCDHKQLSVNEHINVPAYEQYKITCEGKNYVCRDAPFYSKCDLDDGVKK